MFFFAFFNIKNFRPFWFFVIKILVLKRFSVKKFNVKKLSVKISVLKDTVPGPNTSLLCAKLNVRKLIIEIFNAKKFKPNIFGVKYFDEKRTFWDV